MLVVAGEVALVGRPLVRAVGDAVPAVVQRLDVQARLRLSGDIVIRVREVL